MAWGNSAKSGSEIVTMKIQSTSALLLVGFIAIMTTAPMIARKMFDLSKGVSFIAGWGCGIIICIAVVFSSDGFGKGPIRLNSARHI